ncbi:hypothetical protein GW17_00039315 [Ensete ventricosum]|nr:hypothetical protein GW17_00039315 [Ensete ventricosum]
MMVLKLRPNFRQSSNLRYSCGKPSGLLPVISQRAPSKLPDPFNESPSELHRDPTTSSETGPMPKLDLGPLSGCNFIAPVIVRVAEKLAGSWEGLDDAMGARWEFARTSPKVIRKIARNTLGDRRRRTMRLVAGNAKGYQIAGVRSLSLVVMYGCNP